MFKLSVRKKIEALALTQPIISTNELIVLTEGKSFAEAIFHMRKAGWSIVKKSIGNHKYDYHFTAPSVEVIQ